MYGNAHEGTTLYQESIVAIRAAAATPHQLVLMLFDGLMDELMRARSHIVAKRYERKGQSINKCIDILNGLTSSLDYEKGGELVLNLAGLYDYSVYRLYDVSHTLDVDGLDEVIAILENIRQGWHAMDRHDG